MCDWTLERLGCRREKDLTGTLDGGGVGYTKQAQIGRYVHVDVQYKCFRT